MQDSNKNVAISPNTCSLSHIFAILLYFYCKKFDEYKIATLGGTKNTI